MFNVYLCSHFHAQVIFEKLTILIAFQSYLGNSDFDPLLVCRDVEKAVYKLDDHNHFFPLKTIESHQKFIYELSQDSL